MFKKRELNRDSDWFSYKKFTRCSALNQHKSNQENRSGHQLDTVTKQKRGCDSIVTPLILK
jgi:hypothetical protein